MDQIKALITLWKDSFPVRAKKTIELLSQAGLTKDVIDQEVRLVISNPESFPNGIPTILKGTYRKPSKMIEARFNFAGSIIDMSEKWLGISEMEKVWSNKRILNHIESHKKFWDGSAPSVFPFKRLSLFGVTIGEEENQIYLIWPKEGSLEEPQLWRYSGQHEHKFLNFVDFLKWIVENP